MLRDHSPIPQQELGELLCVDANNLVLLLNDLEAREFAFRRRDPADRRRHLVEITDEGCGRSTPPKKESRASRATSWRRSPARNESNSRAYSPKRSTDTSPALFAEKLRRAAGI